MDSSIMFMLYITTVFGGLVIAIASENFYRGRKLQDLVQAIAMLVGLVVLWMIGVSL